MIKVASELQDLYIKNGEDVDADISNRAIKRLAYILDNSSLLDESLYSGIRVNSTELEAGLTLNNLVYMNKDTKNWTILDINSVEEYDNIGFYTNIDEEDVIVFTGVVPYIGVEAGKDYFLSTTEAGKLQDTGYVGALKAGTGVQGNKIRFNGLPKDRIDNIKSSSFVRQDLDTVMNASYDFKKGLYYINAGSMFMPKINSNLLKLDNTKQGYIKIKFPLLWQNASIRFDLSIYDNVTIDGVTNSFTMTIGARNDGANPDWNNAYAIVNGNSIDTFHDVHFGSDGTNSYIYIGSDTTDWNRVVVTCSNFLGTANDNLSKWSDQWIITQEAIKDTISKTVSPGLISSMSKDTLLFAGEPAQNFIRTMSNNTPITIGEDSEGPESYLQQLSTKYSGDSRVNANWIYTSHIESIDERDNHSAGIAIGKDGVFNKSADNTAGDIALHTDGEVKVRISKSGETSFSNSISVSGGIDLSSNISLKSEEAKIISYGTGTASVELVDSNINQEIIKYSEATKNITSLPKEGSIKIGSETKTTDNILQMVTSSTQKNIIELTTAGQGSSEIYIGKSLDYGVGILYNGDDLPDGMGVADDTIFYKNSAGVSVPMFYWNTIEDSVTFAKIPTIEVTPGDKVNVSLEGHTHDAADIGTLGGLNAGQFLRSDEEDTATKAISIGTSSRGLNVLPGDSSSQSAFQADSIHNNEAYLNSSWIYTNVIESPNERDSLSTGIAIGKDGKINNKERIVSLFANGITGYTLAEDGTNTFNTAVLTKGLMTVDGGLVSNNNIILDNSFLSTNASGTGITGILDATTDEKVLFYNEENKKLTLTDNDTTLIVGSKSKVQDNKLSMEVSSGYKNLIEMTTAGQGSSEIYMGQSLAYGMGILYNGDDTPDDLKTADWTVFYKNSNSEKLSMFGWNHTHNFVTFEEVPHVQGVRVSLEDHTHDFGGGLDAELLQGKDLSYFLSTAGTAADSTKLNGIPSEDYALLSSTVNNALSLGDKVASDYLLRETAAGEYLKKVSAEDTTGYGNGIGSLGYIKNQKNIYELDLDGKIVLDGDGLPNILDIEKQTLQTKLLIEDNTETGMVSSSEPILHLKHKKNIDGAYGLLIEMDGESKTDSGVDRPIEIKTNVNGMVFPDYNNSTVYVVNDVVRDKTKDVFNLYRAGSGGTSNGATLGEDTSITWNIYTGESKFLVYGDGEIFSAAGASLGGDLNVLGPVAFSGVCDIGGNTSITGDLGIIGNTANSGTFSNTGAVSFTSTLEVTGSTELKDTLTVQGVTNLNSNTNIEGAVSVAGTIDASGNITANSDRTLKENVKNIDNAMDKISQINGVTYTRNDLEDTNKSYSGVIAQEVEAVLPEVVETNVDTGIKSVAYGNMVGLLIEGMKEQQKTIEALTKRIEDLENL